MTALSYSYIHTLFCFSVPIGPCTNVLFLSVACTQPDRTISLQVAEIVHIDLGAGKYKIKGCMGDVFGAGLQKMWFLTKTSTGYIISAVCQLLIYRFVVGHQRASDSRRESGRASSGTITR